LINFADNEQYVYLAQHTNIIKKLTDNKILKMENTGRTQQRTANSITRTIGERIASPINKPVQPTTGTNTNISTTPNRNNYVNQAGTYLNAAGQRQPAPAQPTTSTVKPLNTVT
jgi:hypothetical protein